MTPFVRLCALLCCSLMTGACVRIVLPPEPSNGTATPPPVVLANGETCTANDSCRSGACSQGVCCDVACTGASSCALAGRVGVCTARVKGTSCAVDVDCPAAASHCVDQVCCTSSCTGLCQSCGIAGSEGECVTVPDNQDPRSVCQQDGQVCRACIAGVCLPALAGSDPASQCTGGNVCDGRGGCALALGQVCDANQSPGCSQGECLAGRCRLVTKRPLAVELPGTAANDVVPLAVAAAPSGLALGVQSRLMVLDVVREEYTARASGQSWGVWMEEAGASVGVVTNGCPLPEEDTMQVMRRGPLVAVAQGLPLRGGASECAGVPPGQSVGAQFFGSSGQAITGVTPVWTSTNPGWLTAAMAQDGRVVLVFEDRETDGALVSVRELESQEWSAGKPVANLESVAGWSAGVVWLESGWAVAAFHVDEPQLRVSLSQQTPGDIQGRSLPVECLEFLTLHAVASADGRTVHMAFVCGSTGAQDNLAGYAAYSPDAPAEERWVGPLLVYPGPSGLPDDDLRGVERVAEVVPVAFADGAVGLVSATAFGDINLLLKPADPHGTWPLRPLERSTASSNYKASDVVASSTAGGVDVVYRASISDGVAQVFVSRMNHVHVGP